jgi:hypothetical protein
MTTLFAYNLYTFMTVFTVLFRSLQSGRQAIFYSGTSVGNYIFQKIFIDKQLLVFIEILYKPYETKKNLETSHFLS